MENLRVWLTSTEDRDSKVTFLKSVIRKNQEESIPPEVPRDLILEAKIRLGDERKASAHRVGLVPSMAPLAVDDRARQIMPVEKPTGLMMSDDERAALDGINQFDGD